ncbi:TetR/AcrR family transcriptional regulator [Metabacillus malikii]|uniref:AcrR family transcriptional regulator n=1 Tax=Metabacillus malikii TaxID=1504265 RepID=A0ABT9ZEI3_9BACI|nr:TetR/AcrR family transcriptional regulator [Metabacillus malikii]MDQ0230653.1 AcrR family transcriptional regulator [Metabacillus malikii]
MPRDENKNLEIRDARKEQILSAAAKVFARRGMVAAKISDIAKEAQLSHGLVYHYFESKEQIFVTLVKKASDKSIEVVNEANQYNGTPIQKLTWMTETILRSIATGEGIYLYLIMIQASTSDAVPAEVRDVLMGDNANSPVFATIPIIIEGQNEGEIVKEDPVKLAVTYYAFIQGLAINKIQWKECPLPEAKLIMNVFQTKQEVTK